MPGWSLITDELIGRKVSDSYELIVLSWDENSPTGRFATLNLSLQEVKLLHKALGEYLADYD